MVESNQELLILFRISLSRIKLYLRHLCAKNSGIGTYDKPGSIVNPRGIAETGRVEFGVPPWPTFGAACSTGGHIDAIICAGGIASGSGTQRVKMGSS